MSLEASIADLNANIQTLISILSARPAALADAEQAEGLAAAVVAVNAETTRPDPLPTEAVEITQKEVIAAVLDLSKAKKRDQVVALLEKYGAAKATELSPVDYPAFMADYRKVLEG
jgi:hypothetical protein